MKNIFLEPKLVGAIEGEFYVPSYQRGYRWGKDEVTRLLDDVYNNGVNNYCLQPIVVRRNGTKYEVIDGQQRLTTLFLIYQYMYNASGGFLDELRFSLEYKTRGKSTEFLNDMDMSLKKDNIDFWFMCNAYETIEEWFGEKEKKSTMTNMNKFFDENVKVIWYEVDETEDTIELFTRLNIGKIPLTSAELVKAMFLSKDSNVGMDKEKQEEISLQWDTIERDLHNDSLWFFLTNRALEAYQTRIDMILNLISHKPSNSHEEYYTFFMFDKMKENTDMSDIWKQIQHTFLILKDWYESHELYHKIGYLIASESNTLQEIFDLSVDKTKKEFKAALDACIRKSVEIEQDYSDLSYEKSRDYGKISRLLLLFNVESVRQIDEQAQRFPFDRYKDNTSWSLEHIHAQQSEGMRKQEEWKEWLRLHIKSLKTIGANEKLCEEVELSIEKERLDRNAFENIQTRVISALSVGGSAEYVHSISNMALLNSNDNAALNNSTFDVKRNLIIEMDKSGRYIPFCTKMVFLKYYTSSEDNQIHFWGQADRVAYIYAINSVLKDYLKNKIVIEKAGE